MKKIFVPFLAFCGLVVTGCSEKFDVAAPYKDITVVYGLIDQSDTAHYIRIQKAFLDDTKSAVVMAGVADSSFYANITVKLQRLSMTDTNRILTESTLTRVDMNKEGYPKEPGIFFTSPNYAYKLSDTLGGAYLYRLVVTNNTTGAVNTAMSPVIIDKNKSVFNIPVVDDTSVTSGTINFASLNVYSPVSGLWGKYTAAYNFSFEGYSTPIGIVQGMIGFNWVDSNMVTGEIIRRHYDYDLGFTKISSGVFRYEPKKYDLVSALKLGMGTAPPTIKRLLAKCDLTFYTATNNFNTYLQVQSLQGVGLTGNEIQPYYTNIRGGKALGLFTSRGVRKGQVTIDASTVRFLDTSSFIASANIDGTYYK